MIGPASSPVPSAPPLLGRFGDPLRFELDLKEGVDLETCEDPFVPLSDAGRLARVLLGRLVSGDGSVLKPVSVKIQRSHYRALGGSGGKELLTNPMIEARWTREREALLKCGGISLVPAIDFGEAGFRSRPLTFCKRRRLYFHPPCPRCGKRLEDCRDDALLITHGLPAYSRSKERFIHCPSCTAGGAERPVFYTTEAPGEEFVRDAQVRRRSELYRDLGERVNAPLSETERQAEAASFPCADCEHRGTCFPIPGEGPGSRVIPAEGLLFPVSYYDFHLLVSEVMEFHFDEWVDLLGGASWSAFRERVRQAGSPGRERSLAAVDARLSGPVQWLFRDDVVERFALEVLHLKLAAFGQVCRAVRDYHAKVREPHLHLSPSQVMVDVLPGATNLPARWSFQVRLIGASGPYRFEPEVLRAGPASGLPVSAPDADRLYVSPLVKGAEFGREESMRVSIRLLQAEGDAIRIEGVASSERARLESWQAGDLIRVAPAGGSWEGLTFWGTLEWREDQGVKFSALLPSGGGFDPERKPADFEAGIAWHPRFGVSCDLYSLGLLLFRTLLGNDASPMSAVDDAVQRVLRRVSVWSEGKRSPAASRVAAELLAQAGQEAERFAASALLYEEEARDEAPKPVPSRLWSDLLLFGFKLSTTIPGFSFACGHADAPADRPESLMDAVLGELDLLESRVRIELFGRSERDQMIGDACGELLAEFEGGS
jgi:hypothetical protein